MSHDDVIRIVRTFISDNLLYMRPDFDLGVDDSLFERSVIDSMGVMELITFLEEEFGLTVADHDISEENLGSLAGIARYVVRTQQAQSVGGTAGVGS